MATQRTQQTTLHLGFTKAERIPQRGDTVIMEGLAGTRYAVTIHRVLSTDDDGQHVHLIVRASRRVMAN